MTDTTSTTFTWNNNLVNLVFKFNIAPGNPPSGFTLLLSAKNNSGGPLSMESTDGRIDFNNVIVGGFPLNGKIWLVNVNSTCLIQSDLVLGESPKTQSLEGAISESH